METIPFIKHNQRQSASAGMHIPLPAGVVTKQIGVRHMTSVAMKAGRLEACPTDFYSMLFNASIGHGILQSAESTQNSPASRCLLSLNREKDISGPAKPVGTDMGIVDLLIQAEGELEEAGGSPLFLTRKLQANDIHGTTNSAWIVREEVNPDAWPFLGIEIDGRARSLSHRPDGISDFMPASGSDATVSYPSEDQNLLGSTFIKNGARLLDNSSTEGPAYEKDIVKSHVQSNTGIEPDVNKREIPGDSVFRNGIATEKTAMRGNVSIERGILHNLSSDLSMPGQVRGEGTENKDTSLSKHGDFSGNARASWHGITSDEAGETHKGLQHEQVPRNINAVVDAFQPGKNMAGKDAGIGDELSGIKGNKTNLEKTDNPVLFSNGQSSEKPAECAQASCKADTVDKTFKGEILDQIVKKAVLDIKGGQSTIKIDLHPEVLGRLRMHVSTDNHQVMVRILTEVPMVKEIIENNLAQLRAELQNHGLGMDKLDVFVADDPGKDSEQYGRPSSFSMKNAAANVLEDADEHESEPRAYSTGMRNGDGSVDFFA